MANKEQKRSKKEVRKPKQAKAAPAAKTSAFVVTPGRAPGAKS